MRAREAVDCALSGANGLLSGFRALDLTNADGYVCGKVLAALGVDVWKVERPGGDPGRYRGPFIGGEPDPDKGIYWHVFNTDKKSVTLNLETVKGRDIFLRMAVSADFVIESFPPGYLDRLGIGYSALKAVNPRIILTSITPFGQNTSRSGHRGGELICSALGGVMDNIGDPDRAPLVEPTESCIYHAGVAAATGTVLAHYGREMSGQGEHVDVSIQEVAVTRSAANLVLWDFDKRSVQRMGPFTRFGTTKVRTIWKLKDGFVNWTMFAGVLGARANAALSRWMDEVGMDNPLREVKDWKTLDLPSVPKEQLDRWEAAIAEFFLGRTKEEIRTEGSRRKISATVLDGPDDLLANPQLHDREFWMEMDYPEWGMKLPMPRYFFLSNETENFTRRRAPFIGEHNEEIYRNQLGLSGEELKALQQEGVI